jgi:hypothetical protein
MIQLTLESLPDPVLTHMVSFIPVELNLHQVNKRFYQVFNYYLKNLFDDLEKNLLITGLIQEIKIKHPQWSARRKLIRVVKAITKQLVNSVYFNKDIENCSVSQQLNQLNIMIWKLNCEYVDQFKRFIDEKPLADYPQNLKAPLKLAICYLSPVQSTQEKIEKIHAWLKRYAQVFQNIPMRELIIIKPIGYLYR